MMLKVVVGLRCPSHLYEFQRQAPLGEGGLVHPGRGSLGRASRHRHLTAGRG